MKLLFENWRGFLNEVTAVPNEIKALIWQAIEDSRFWEQPNTVDVRDVAPCDTTAPRHFKPEDGRAWASGCILM
jgi:hypothetical protein